MIHTLEHVILALEMCTKSRMHHEINNHFLHKTNNFPFYRETGMSESNELAGLASLEKMGGYSNARINIVINPRGL